MWQAAAFAPHPSAAFPHHRPLSPKWKHVPAVSQKASVSVSALRPPSRRSLAALSPRSSDAREFSLGAYALLLLLLLMWCRVRCEGPPRDNATTIFRSAPRVDKCCGGVGGGGGGGSGSRSGTPAVDETDLVCDRWWWWWCYATGEGGGGRKWTPRELGATWADDDVVNGTRVVAASGAGPRRCRTDDDANDDGNREFGFCRKPRK